MFRRSTGLMLALVLVTTAGVSGQSAPAPARQAGAGAPLGLPKPPLFFEEPWKDVRTDADKKRCITNLHDQYCEPAVTQANVANPNLELLLFGAGKKRVENGEVLGAVLAAGSHLFSGAAERPFAVALRDRNNFVDLSGLGKIRWATRASGLHLAHPIVRLADGTWLLGEHGEPPQREMHTSEFIVSDERWIKMDMERVVTMGAQLPEPVDAAKARQIEQANARGEWLDASQVDLSKVDAVGFADLLPASGHGYGGFVVMDTIEVYGKPVPR